MLYTTQPFRYCLQLIFILSYRPNHVLFQPHYTARFGTHSDIKQSAVDPACVPNVHKKKKRGLPRTTSKAITRAIGFRITLYSMKLFMTSKLQQRRADRCCSGSLRHGPGFRFSFRSGRQGAGNGIRTRVERRRKGAGARNTVVAVVGFFILSRRRVLVMVSVVVSHLYIGSLS